MRLESGRGLGVSRSMGNVTTVEGGKTPRTARMYRRTMFCQVLCSVLYIVFVHHHICFKDDKSTFREVQYLVRGHTATRRVEQFLNFHSSDFKIHAHNHYPIFLEVGSITTVKKKILHLTNIY